MVPIIDERTFVSIAISRSKPYISPTSTLGHSKMARYFDWNSNRRWYQLYEDEVFVTRWQNYEDHLRFPISTPFFCKYIEYRRNLRAYVLEKRLHKYRVIINLWRKLILAMLTYSKLDRRYALWKKVRRLRG